MSETIKPAETLGGLQSDRKVRGNLSAASIVFIRKAPSVGRVGLLGSLVVGTRVGDSAKTS